MACISISNDLKQRQFLHFFIFIIAASLLYLFQSIAFVFDVLLLIGTAIGVMELASLVRTPGGLRYSRVFYVAILMGSGLGTVLFMLLNGTLHADSVQYWQRNGLIYTQVGLSRALAADYLAVALLHIVSVYEPDLRFEEMKKLRDQPRSEFAQLVGFGLIVLALVSGKLGFGGIVAQQGQDGISPLASLAVLMLPGLVTLTFMIIISTRIPLKRLFFGGMFVILTLVLMMYQRRALLYTMVICGMVWFLFNKATSRKAIIKTAMLSALAACVLYVGFLGFFSIRVMNQYTGGHAGLKSELKLVATVLSHGGMHYLQSGLQNNVQGRTMTLGYLGGFMSQPRNHLPIYGEEITMALKAALPSVLFDKSGVTTAPETIVHPLVGIPVYDGPNSVLTGGYDDFGIVGIVIYPTLFIIIARAVLFLLFKYVFKSTYVYCFFTVCMIFTFFTFGIEASITYLFINLRNLIIVGFILKIMMYIGGYMERFSFNFAKT